MAYVHHYDHFDVLRSKRSKRSKRTKQGPIAQFFCGPENSDLMNLEFSNYGRNPRFPAGWFILPAVVVGMAIVAALILVI